jgi:hypothetical protein
MTLGNILDKAKWSVMDKGRVKYADLFRKYRTPLPPEMKLLDDKKLWGGFIVYGKSNSSLIFWPPFLMLSGAKKGEDDIVKHSLKNECIPICLVTRKGKEGMYAIGVFMKEREFTFYELVETMFSFDFGFGDSSPPTEGKIMIEDIGEAKTLAELINRIMKF